MDRRRSVLVALVVAPLLLTAVGCKKKEPVAPPPPPEPPPAAPEVVPPPPPPVVDEVEEPMPLPDVQEMAESKGLLGDVFFEFDAYELEASAKDRLANNADWMKSEDGDDYTFTIEGHCDERGTNEYNLALGQRRANAALDYIVSLGVDRARFKTISYGEERPFCRDSNESCWQKNRRARFVINGRR